MNYENNYNLLSHVGVIDIDERIKDPQSRPQTLSMSKFHSPEGREPCSEKGKSRAETEEYLS